MASKNTLSALEGLRDLSNEADLHLVQQRIIASGVLTVDEMNAFFKKNSI